MKNTLLIIDGSALLTTVYYGTLPTELRHHLGENEEQYYPYIRQTGDGIYTNAIYGFLLKLEELLDSYAPSHLAITFDVSREDTFRKKLYPSYKGQRRETPLPLKMQKQLIQDILQDMNIPVFSHKEYEGDDIIGSLAKQFANDDMHVLLYANDRDMTQLVNQNVRMWYTAWSIDKAKDKYEQFVNDMHVKNAKPYESLPIPSGVFVFNPITTKWAFGVTPEQIPDWKGLGGDVSDNIPGVKGISEEGAAKILQKFPNIEAVFQFIHEKDAINPKQTEEQWVSMELRKASLTALRKPEAEEMAYLSKTLATIKTDIPILQSIKQFSVRIDYKAEEKWKEKLDLIYENEYDYEYA